MTGASPAVDHEAVAPRQPFYWEGEHLAIELPGARALFTTRRGGRSEGAFATLNLGRLTADDPEAVGHNRARLQARAGGRLSLIRQVHGSRVLRLREAAEASGPEPQSELEEADAQATGARGVAPMVMTADCLPVALAGGGAVAIVHAGWRGLAGGIIAAGVQAVRELGDPQARVAAAIGPGAGVCCYEVGAEVRARFPAHATRGRNLDLKTVAREQLLAAGVGEVHDAGLCTICSPPSLFFSHRRDAGVTGRQAGVVWLT